MPPEDLDELLRKRPFEPFRIQVSDGTFYDIRHPELVMVGVESLVIGVPVVGKKIPLYERTEKVALSHVVKLLPVDEPTAKAGGTSIP